jgi:hypothetical protein
VRANVDGKNVWRFDSELQELEAVGGAQVEEMPTAPAGGRAKTVSGKAGTGKGPEDIPSNLVTALPDTWTKSRQDGRGLGAVALLHSQDRFLQDTPGRSLPTAVDGGDHALSFFHQNDRKAVGRLDDEKNAAEVRDRGVTPEPAPRHPVDELNDIRVDLLEEEGLEIQTARKPSQVLLSPGSVAEPMPQKRDALEPGNCYDTWQNFILPTSSRFPIEPAIRAAMGPVILTDFERPAHQIRR